MNLTDAIKRTEDYAMYLLTQRRGIFIRECTNQKSLFKRFREEYNPLFVKNYAEYTEMDTKELKKYNLFVFMDAAANLKSWKQKAVQKLSRQKTRAKRFVFMMDSNHRPAADLVYMLSKCLDEPVGDLRLRYCEVETAHDGSLRFRKDLDRRVYELYYREQDHLVSYPILIDRFTNDEDEHSRFGPSGLAQLAKCPGSLWLDEPYERSTGAADLGTTWHIEAENALNDLQRVARWAPIYHYVEFCIDTISEGVQWGIETPLKDESIHKEFWGTCDFYAWNEKTKTLTICDYKNGKFPVEAEQNVQLKAYAVLVANHLNVKPKKFELVIAQRGKYLNYWYVDGRVLNRWRKDIKEIIHNALAAEKEPTKHLNHKECFSAFCPARAIHKEERQKYAKERRAENELAEASGRSDSKV